MAKKVLALVVVLLLPVALLAAPAPEVKDPAPPVGDSGLAPTASGGPDAFGYVWHDMSEADVTFSWIDISGTGTNMGTGDDSAFLVTLDFPFDFYGTTYTQLAFATNGYLSTDPTDTGPDLSNDCPLPATPSTGGGARIYPLHDDLVVTAGAYYQYFATCPRPDNNGLTPGCMVFQWNGTEHFGDTTLFDFEAILYDQSYEIAVQTSAGNPETGSGSTTGIQNDGATIGLTYACDTAASMPDDFAVSFFVPGQGAPTPLPDAIPTMNNWGIVIFLLVVAGVAVILLRRRS